MRVEVLSDEVCYKATIARALLTFTIVMIASAATAGASNFRTPSGNIRCATDASSVSCIVLSEKIPPSRAGTRHFYILTGRDVIDDYAGWIHARRYKVLAYGQSVRVRSILCMAGRSGLLCVNLQAGHGFFLSRQRQNVF